MELLIFLLLSPTIFALDYKTDTKSNDEPFLPIFPVYPYNSKLIKRGTGLQMVTKLTPELHATNADIRDSYTVSNDNNFQRDSYFLNNHLYQKASTPAMYSSYYGSNPSPYTSNPYTYSNSYARVSPYTTSPYSAAPYSNYFYQPPHYTPVYYNQPYSPFLLPSSSLLYSQSPKSDLSEDSDNKGSKKNKKSEDKKEQHKNSKQDSNDNEFVDGANYTSDNSVNLDGQSGFYKKPNSDDKQYDGSREKNKTIYRLVNIAEQQTNPDYFLSSNLARIQLEQLLRQILIKLLTQNVVQQPNQKKNKNDKNYVPVGNPIAKTGLAYVNNPGVYNKVNSAHSIPSLNVQSQISFNKNVQYPNLQYDQNPVASVKSERSNLYITPLKMNKNPATTEVPNYVNYESSPSAQEIRNYSESSNLDESQDSVSYSTQNVVTVKTPQDLSYHYSTYSDQLTEETDTEKDSTENFKSKQKSTN